MSEVAQFEVQVLNYEEVHHIPGDWTGKDVLELLSILEVDTSDAAGEADLRDLLLMGLSDMDSDASADIVLEYVFGDTMTKGVRQNLVQDLEDDRPWEQFADPTKQAGVFRAVTLLQEVFPKQFGIPDAARIRVQLSSQDKDGAAELRGAMDPALLVRLLAAGMADRSILRRLFDEAIQDGPFPEAQAIVWHLESIAAPADAQPNTTALEVYSSIQWLGPLEDVDAYQAKVVID